MPRNVVALIYDFSSVIKNTWLAFSDIIAGMLCVLCANCCQHQWEPTELFLLCSSLMLLIIALCVCNLMLHNTVIFVVNFCEKFKVFSVSHIIFGSKNVHSFFSSNGYSIVIGFDFVTENY